MSPLFSPRIGLHWILLCTVSKTGRSGAFHQLLGQEVQLIREHYPSMKGDLLDLVKSMHGEMQEYPEVPPPPLFSLYRHIQPKVHCQFKIWVKSFSSLVCRIGSVRVHSDSSEGDRKCECRCIIKIRSIWRTN